MVTIADVAAHAGVGAGTVSRVLNGRANVRGQTRNRVLAAIQQLGYRPNTAARALATGRTRVIGVVTLDTTLFGPPGRSRAASTPARTAWCPG